MSPPTPAAPTTVRMTFDVPAFDERWVLDDGDNVPESPLHDDIILLLQLILGAWVTRTQRDAKAGRNVALRWDPANPSIGVDPDVYLVEPAPPITDRSLLTWKAGHHPPRVAVEVVSETTPEKDYLENPAKYGASGTHELWVFDPQRYGPSSTGGPFLLQIWRRTKGEFRRVYAGDGPAYSRELRAWLVVTNEGTRLRVASDAPGRKLWLTESEHERDEKEAALRRVAELEARLAALEGTSTKR